VGSPSRSLTLFKRNEQQHPASPTLLRALTQAKARGGSAASYLKLTKKKTLKTAQGYSSTSSTGPPVIPAVIAEKVVAYIAKVKLGGKKGVVDTVARYWSLKREARRGAPLLKRIHLEVRLFFSLPAFLPPFPAFSFLSSSLTSPTPRPLAALDRLRHDPPLNGHRQSPQTRPPPTPPKRFGEGQDVDGTSAEEGEEET